MVFWACPICGEHFPYGSTALKDHVGIEVSKYGPDIFRERQKTLTDFEKPTFKQFINIWNKRVENGTFQTL